MAHLRDSSNNAKNGTHVVLFQSYVVLLGAATIHTTFEMTQVCFMVTDSVYSSSSCTEDIPLKAFRIQQFQSHQLKLVLQWTNDFKCDMRVLYICEPQGNVPGTFKYDK